LVVPMFACGIPHALVSEPICCNILRDDEDRTWGEGTAWVIIGLEPSLPKRSALSQRKALQAGNSFLSQLRPA
jgi:hypothetical protein